MISVDYPAEVAQLILDAAVAGLTAAGIAVPVRRYITQTQPAVDCEQLVVQVAAILPHNGNPGAPGLSRTHARVVHPLSLQAVVWHHRCVPMVDEAGAEVVLPTKEAENESGQNILADGVAIWRGILAETGQGGTLGPRLFVPQGWAALTNDGGYGGGSFTFLIGLAEQSVV